MKPKQKAWSLNTNYIGKWHYCHNNYDIVYAETRGKAKTLMLSIIKNYDYVDKLGNEITFTNIKVLRNPEYDKFLVDGELKTKVTIDYENKVKERNESLDKLLSENPDGKAYIRKGSYYYRPNNCGYTEYRAQAGVYSLKEAIQEVKGCDLNDCMNVILIDVTEHNKELFKTIGELKSRVIA